MAFDEGLKNFPISKHVLVILPSSQMFVVVVVVFIIIIIICLFVCLFLG